MSLKILPIRDKPITILLSYDFFYEAKLNAHILCVYIFVLQK